MSNTPTNNECNDLSDAIRYAAKTLGLNGATTEMGAIEAHAQAVREAGDSIASAIRELAESINAVASVVKRNKQ